MSLGLGIKSKIYRWRRSLQKRRIAAQKPYPYQQHYQYNNVACLVVKNEAGILEEWLLFHLAVGFDYVVIIDNNSNDQSRELLEPYRKAGLLEWREMPVEPFSAWQQILEYNKVIADFRGRARWLWFLDSDEFLVPAEADRIDTISAKLAADESVGGIAVNWLFFGTAGVEKLGTEEWHIEKLNRRAPLQWQRHKAVKSGLRPEASAGFFESPHLPYFFKDRKAVYANGQPYNGQQIDHSILKVHHYWHRTESFFRRVKLPRRELLVGTTYGPRGKKLHYDMHNKEEDRSMARFTGRMREIKKRVLAGQFSPSQKK